MKEDRSLTPKEVAGILKIAKNTVYELVKRGELPAYRVGRKIRIELNDVLAYKQQGKRSSFLPAPGPSRELPPVESMAGHVVVCGQDVLLDILARHLEKSPGGKRVFRHHVGSFAGLTALYHGQAHMAAIHLWDGDSGKYNVPFVRHMLPGVPAVIIHLACRMQGFYVAEGNPHQISHWRDLTKSGVRFINREKGCGTRVLLDEQLRLQGIDRKAINGYENEETSHLAVASTVARGEADAGLGNEKASLQVRGIDFIPMQKERYELIIKKEDLEKPECRAVLDIVRSPLFKSELKGLGDYDLTETGTIVAET